MYEEIYVVTWYSDVARFRSAAGVVFWSAPIRRRPIRAAHIVAIGNRSPVVILDSASSNAVTIITWITIYFRYLTRFNCYT